MGYTRALRLLTLLVNTIRSPISVLNGRDLSRIARMNIATQELQNLCVGMSIEGKKETASSNVYKICIVSMLLLGSRV